MWRSSTCAYNSIPLATAVADTVPCMPLPSSCILPHSATTATSSMRCRSNQQLALLACWLLCILCCRTHLPGVADTCMDACTDGALCQFKYLPTGVEVHMDVGYEPADDILKHETMSCSEEDCSHAVRIQVTADLFTIKVFVEVWFCCMPMSTSPSTSMRLMLGLIINL